MSTNLKGMTWDHPRGLDSVANSNELLRAEVGVTVEWDARSLLAFGDQPIVEFYNEYDLMIIDHPHVPDAVHAKAVLALEDLLSIEELAILNKTSVGQSHASYQYRGSQWALAIDTAAQVSAFRSDKADRAPIFWDEVLELAQKGTVLWAQKPVDAFSTFATLMAQREAPLTNKGSFINKDVAADVLSFMIELSAKVPDFCLSSNPIDVAEALARDERYIYGICMYGYSNYSRIGFRENLLTYDDLPSFDGQAAGSQLGGAGIAVSSKSKDPQLAARIALLLSSPDIQSTAYMQAGGQPGNLIAWKSASANQFTNNFFINTLRTLERAWVRPRIFGWPEVQFASSQIIHRILTEKKFSSQDLDAIENTYELHIKESV
jgi:multiple sugar transport system substrate-binding protein